MWTTVLVAVVLVVYGRSEARKQFERQAEASTGKIILEDLAKAPDATGLPVLFALPGFDLIDQDEKKVTRETLLADGRVNILAFFFTQCAGPCPSMSLKMSKLQDDIAEKSVRLVSVSVDPERDTPEVLREYAKEFEAEAGRWMFLTGERTQVFNLSEGLKLAASPAQGEHAITHSEKLVLVDSAGRVRGVYSSKDDMSVIQLAADATKLARSAKLPDSSGGSPSTPTPQPK